MKAFKQFLIEVKNRSVPENDFRKFILKFYRNFNIGVIFTDVIRGQLNMHIHIEGIELNIQTKIHNLFQKEIKKRGWFITGPREHTENRVFYKLEARDVEKPVKTPQFLYHLTSKFDWEHKIVKQGLIPKSAVSISGTFTHPERIYFFMSKDSTQQIENYVKKIKGNVDLIILKIDTNKLKKVAFYRDVRITGAYYTKAHISQKAIVDNELYAELYGWKS